MVWEESVNAAQKTLTYIASVARMRLSRCVHDPVGTMGAKAPIIPPFALSSLTSQNLPPGWVTLQVSSTGRRPSNEKCVEQGASNTGALQGPHKAQPENQSGRG